MKNKDKIAKELQKKISKEFGLKETNKKKNLDSFDMWLNELQKKYGTTKY